MTVLTLESLNKALHDMKNHDVRRASWNLTHRLCPMSHIVHVPERADTRVLPLPHWMKLSHAYGWRAL